MENQTSTERPKRVLIFSFVYFPNFVGGAEIAIKEITDRFSLGEVEFDLIALRLDESLQSFEKVGNVNVYRIGPATAQKHSSDSLPKRQHFLKFAYPFLAAMKATRLHKKNKYTATWSMMANYSGFGGLIFKLFNMDVPMLLTLQEGDPIDYIKKRVRFVYPFFKMIFTKADVVQVISNYLGDFARSMGFSGPLFVVPNGVNVAHFSQNYEEKELRELSNTLGKETGDIFLVTTSRLVVKNAVSDVIRALTFLPPIVKFLVIGRGYEADALKALAKELGVLERVKFIGYVSHKEMPKYLKISDVFIRPSLSEGFGNSFVEAMASGLPVIATNVGGIPDFLKNKETGIFCEVSDPKDIARKVEIYLRDVNLRKEIIDNAMHMVIDKYDWKTVSHDMKEKVFDTIFQKR